MYKWFIFILACISSSWISGQHIRSIMTDSTTAIVIDSMPLLTYHHATKSPPEGVHPLYQRSGFFHPVRTMRGHTMTTIQPDDHYHHYGLWNAWTHVDYAGDTLDFWNLAKGEGTVRFKQYPEKQPVNQPGRFTVQQEHVVLKQGVEQVALDEIIDVQVVPINQKMYAIDFHFSFQCARDIPFKILEYRYAGFCWRTPQAWYQENSQVLTSTGLNRTMADGSRADWFMIQGKLDDQFGGALIMSHPENFSHPQPLRIWPPQEGERSEIMAMFAPTKFSDWSLIPGKKYSLKYRMVVFDGKMVHRKADRLWKMYRSE